MPSQVCRWGILGTANIARKNWKGMRLAGNAVLTAVASRDTSRAEAFIRECQAEVPFVETPRACGSYEELLAREDVDAVYIPLPTGIRPEWVIRAAEAGKHILCEKPCGSTAKDVQAMLDACSNYNVQFMDGVMFMHSARLPQLRQVLDDGETVGTLKRIATQFSFAAPEEFLKGNIRVSRELEPLGCLGDLGWYNIRFSLWVMNGVLPEKVSGRLLAEHGREGGTVPLEFSGELFFPGGVSASFYCSFITENQQWAHLSGSKGSVRLNDFVLPFHGGNVGFQADAPRFDVQGCSFHMCSQHRDFRVPEYSDGHANAQETNMIRTFSGLVLSGKRDASWGTLALQTQQVLDACLASAHQQGQLVKVPA